MFIDGVKLTQIRVWRGFTRTQLSELTGIEETKIMAYERTPNKIVPKKHLNALYKALDINYNNIRIGG